jgi:hypothetical protein
VRERYKDPPEGDTVLLECVGRKGEFFNLRGEGGKTFFLTYKKTTLGAAHMVEVDDDEEEEEVVALEPDDAAAMEDSDSAYEPSESDVDGSDSDDSIPRPFRRAGNAMAVAVVRPNVPAEVDDVVDDAAPLSKYSL